MRLPTFIACALILLAIPAEAEVRLNQPAPNRVEVVSDGPSSWRLGFSTRTYPPPKLVPAGPDRRLFVHGSALHLIDCKNGIVLQRWIFPARIEAVEVEGDGFRVKEAHWVADQRSFRTTTIKPGESPPFYWMEDPYLYRDASFEGSWLDKESHFEVEVRNGVRSKRTPLLREDAEALLVSVEEAARRNPFLTRLAVVEALLLKDAGRREQADATFRAAMERKTNHFGELFFIAQSLEDIDEPDWSTVAFDRAYDLFLKQGSDPRLVSLLIPKLTMGYLPFDLGTQIPVSRRAELSERLYRISPYGQGTSAAWSALAVYFDEAGDHPQAALWQARAAESARQSGYIWEFGVYTARALRLTLALLAAVIVYGVILQGRYAPARRLLRQPGFRNWLRRRDPRWSLSFWSRRDRLAMTLLVLFLWLTFGVFGTFGESGARMESAPQSFGAGSLRATDARSFLESLAESPDRNFLLALSLHQQGEHAAAEPLYRAVSHSAEAWNNLGVLLADQGRAQESADSFRKALEIDPEMKEAAFNLGQPATGYWVDLHRERLPGQKMLATPSHDMVYRAMRGPLPQFAGHILMGPFSAARALKTIQYWSYEASNQDAPLPLRIVTGIRILWTLGLCLVFGGLLLLLYVAPYREVLRTPSRWHRFLQLAGPGASPRWQALGGIVLGLFVYFIFESAFQDYFAWFNWPLASGRAFGLPTTLKAAFQNAWPPAASTTTWSIASAALLFAVNAVMVLHEFGTRKKI